MSVVNANHALADAVVPAQIPVRRAVETPAIAAVPGRVRIARRRRCFARGFGLCKHADQARGGERCDGRRRGRRDQLGAMAIDEAGVDLARAI